MVLSKQQKIINGRYLACWRVDCPHFCNFSDSARVLMS
jgi:hypothetical protein